MGGDLITTTGSIIIALITAGVPAIKLFLDNRALKSQNNDLKKDIKDASINIQFDLEFFNAIKNNVTTLLNETKTDRFLILSATNGKSDMRFATALYEQHADSDKIKLSIGATSKYVKFEFDSEYRKMLKEAEATGAVSYSTKQMKDSDLKSIYELEQINHAEVHFMFRAKINEGNDRIFYCSIATHGEDSFTSNEKILIRLAVDRMKTLFEELPKV